MISVRLKESLEQLGVIIIHAYSVYVMHIHKKKIHTRFCRVVGG